MSSAAFHHRESEGWITFTLERPSKFPLESKEQRELDFAFMKAVMTFAKEYKDE